MQCIDRILQYFIEVWAWPDDAIRTRPLRPSWHVVNGRPTSQTIWEYVLCSECTGQGNEFELISTVKMETRNPLEGYFGSELPAICNHCGVIAAWSRKTLKNLINVLHFFGKKLPLTVKFSKLCSESFHRLTDRRVVFKFREIWRTWNRWNRALRT